MQRGSARGEPAGPVAGQIARPETRTRRGSRAGSATSSSITISQSCPSAGFPSSRWLRFSNLPLAPAGALTKRDLMVGAQQFAPGRRQHVRHALALDGQREHPPARPRSRRATQASGLDLRPGHRITPRVDAPPPPPSAGSQTPDRWSPRGSRPAGRWAARPTVPRALPTAGRRRGRRARSRSRNGAAARGRRSRPACATRCATVARHPCVHRCDGPCGPVG